MAKGWIGVDLDGTLAEYDGWKGPDQIGRPIPAMVTRVKQWLNAGIDVKIMTGRAADPEYIPPIKDWLKENGLPDLEITNEKDPQMISLWDDRCVPVETNTGRNLLESKK